MMPRRRRLEGELLGLACFLVLSFAMSAIVDPDLPGHIAYGQDHWDSGELARADPYSYTVLPGERWVNHEWLFELGIGQLFRLSGSSGLVVLLLLTWGSVAGLVLWGILRQTRDLVPGILSFLGFAAVAFAAMTIRPQLATYLLYALLLTWLELARAGRLWALLPAAASFALWVNLHGGFLAGLGVFGLYAAGLVGDALLGRSPRGDLVRAPERPGRLALAACAAGLLAGGLLLVNPYGGELFAFLEESLGKARPQISEWRPSDPREPQDLIFLVYALLSAWALAARERSRVPLPHLLVLGVTALMALRHARHQPFFAIAAALFATGALAELYRNRVPPPADDVEARSLWHMRLLAALVLLPALALNLAWPHRDTLRLRLHPQGNSPFPTGALQHLDAHPELRGNLLVHFDWAQLMIWRYYPRLRVFYDGRFRTVYRAELEEAYFGFVAPEAQDDWRRALDAYPTDFVLLPAQHPAAERLLSAADWRVLYSDPQALLFARHPAGTPKPDPALGPHPQPVLPFEPRAR